MDIFKTPARVNDNFQAYITGITLFDKNREQESDERIMLAGFIALYRDMATYRSNN